MHAEAVAEEEKEKKGRSASDPSYPGSPQELEKNPEWKETTHPGQRQAGHREFKNENTGERIRFDKGKLGEHGHKEHDHYHRFDPNNKKRKFR